MTGNNVISKPLSDQGNGFFCARTKGLEARMETNATVTVTVNGKERHLAANLTLDALVRQMGALPERVVVERNLAIVPAGELASTTLLDGDSVEIVHFVGGG